MVPQKTLNYEQMILGLVETLSFLLNISLSVDKAAGVDRVLHEILGNDLVADYHTHSSRLVQLLCFQSEEGR